MFSITPGTTPPASSDQKSLDVARAPQSHSPNGRWRGPSLPVVTTLLCLAAGIVSRLLEPFSIGDFDETIYAQTLLLWLRGAPPYQETFYSQGPLFLALLAPFALVLGRSLDAIQLGVTFWGACGLVAVALIGRHVGGAWGAAVATATWAASPLLTHLDTHVLAEGPAIALAAMATALACVPSASGRVTALTGALLGASLAVKALMPVTALPVALARLRPPHTIQARALTLLVLGGTSLMVLLLTLLPFGLGTAWDQLVTYRLDARVTAGAPVNALERALTRGLADDVGTLAAAALGLAVLLWRSRSIALVLSGWLVLTLVVLAAHAPLFPRHTGALLLPLAALSAGAGLLVRDSARGLPVVPALVVVLTIGLSVPAHISRFTESTGPGDLAEAATAIAAISPAGEYVLTDMPAIALLADRLIVPSLVDMSQVRIRSGRLTAESVAQEVVRYQPAAVLFWLGRMDSGPMESFPATLTEKYTRVWQNRPGQSLWMREDTAAISSRSIPGLRELSDVRAEGGLVAQAIGYSGQVRAGEPWRLRVLWELSDAPPDIEEITLVLTQGERRQVPLTRLPFSAEKPLSHWPVGARRMVQYVITVPSDSVPGRYVPTLRLYAAEGREIPFIGGRGQSGGALELPPIQVVRADSAR